MFCVLCSLRTTPKNEHICLHKDVCCFFYRTHDSDSSSNEENYPIPQRFFAVTCTGRQPNVHPEVDGEVFVFGPDLQLDENGMVIPECDRKYIWVPEILKQLRHNVNAIPILPSLPIQNALNYIVTGINHIAGDNTCSGIFLLGRCIFKLYCWQNGTRCKGWCKCVVVSFLSCLVGF